MLGKTFSHYRIVDALGKGGMGVVYRAADERLGRFVALKFLPEEFSDDPQARERFKREARAASSLNHPNICTIYDVGETDGRSFIAMELVEGDTLQKLLAERRPGKPLANAEILDIAILLAGALDAAHSKGIVHRDIKPANIIVDREGQPKLLDFGLASFEHAFVGHANNSNETAMGSVGLTSPGSTLGTAAYMAPEQARGEEVDARCDLFSFGAVLYEMCSGRAAFGEATIALTFDRILHREPAPLLELNPGLLPGLDLIVRKALTKEKEERYQSAADMRADLRRLRRESESGKAPVAVSGAVASTAAASRMRKMAYAGVLLIVLAAITSGAYIYHEHHAVLPVASQAEWVPLTNFADSVVSPAISPDGRLLAFIRGSDTFFGAGQVYAKLLPDGDPVQLTHDPTDKMAPAFSPDGARLAYTTIRDGWDSWMVPVLGGQPRLMLANAAGLNWIDGQHLLFSEIRTGLHMSLVTAGENREGSRDVYVPPRERGMVHRSAISPDHKWVLLVHMDNGGWLPCLLVPFNGGSSPRTVGPSAGGCTYVAWSPDGAWMYFSSDAGGRFHIWRQRFPDGEPQQVTSGATEEEGIAVAPDGRSLITSVGLAQSTVVVRTAKGDKEVSSESYTERPQFSADGRYIFYLVPAKGAPGHDFASGDLYRADLEKEGSEHLLPGFTMKGYALSADGKQVVFSAPDANGRTALWSADLELRSPPREFPSSTNEDEPLTDAAGHIYFRASEGGSNFLYRMNADGSDRSKVSSGPILELYSVSPDGRWAVVWQADAGNSRASYATAAIPLHGGPPLAICLDLCEAFWGENGKTFAILSATGGGQTLLAKVGPSGLPALPSEGVNPVDLKTLKGARVVNELIAPGPLPDQYVIIHQTVHRNLYRIPLR